MTQTDWPASVVATIASQVRRYRRVQQPRMSMQQLADRTQELGMRIPHAVLANLESGRRETVSVAELIIFAKALDVTPARLVIPPGEIEMFPGVTWSAQKAMQWFSYRPCDQCRDSPPEGFTCNTCGRSGS